MTPSEPPRATTRRIPRILVHGLLALVAAIAATRGYELLAPSSSTAAAPAHTPRIEHRGPPDEPGAPPARVANLDQALLAALRQATADAAEDGVEIVVNSGWRSPEDQEELLREAVSEYGSEAEAARWVATADTSPHVSGDAVDVGPSEATAWLSGHGAAYGLCQIYGNEPWHYELRPEAVDGGCPPMYADPTHDPRMQQ
jgi:LAS superfamily LD-carboxypeptidase LdcB